MNRGRLVLVAAVAVTLVQIGILLSMIAGRAAILRDGQEVALRVEPVDPRDLLRGDYVVLGYNISMIGAELFSDATENFPAGRQRDVHVRLAVDETGIFQPVAARFDRRLETVPNPGEVDIRGTSTQRLSSSGLPIRVEYGIERFYIPEGEGGDIERGMLERDFIMRVAVAGNGMAQIKAFLDGNRVLYEEPWY